MGDQNADLLLLAIFSCNDFISCGRQDILSSSVSVEFRPIANVVEWCVCEACGKKLNDCFTNQFVSLFFFFCFVCPFSVCVVLSLLTLLGTISWLGLTACPSSRDCGWSLRSGQPFYTIHCMEEEWACLTAGMWASQLAQFIFSYKAFCRIC